MVVEIFNRFLIEHPIIQEHEHLSALADDIDHKLGELYVLIGSESGSRDPHVQEQLRLRVARPAV
jgi:hypothetical protein